MDSTQGRQADLEVLSQGKDRIGQYEAVFAAGPHRRWFYGSLEDTSGTVLWMGRS